MVEPGKGLVILGAALGSKEIVVKLLGPTADYLGGELQEFTQKRVENVKTIFRHARERLGEKLEKPGVVPPRVLRSVIEEGSWIDDELVLAYFGGVLASSRTETGRDDRGVAWVSLLTRLSKYQIRAHYIAYTQMRTNSEVRMQSSGPIVLHGDFQMSRTDFCGAMDFDEYELLRYDALVEHIINGLSRESLIENAYYGRGHSGPGAVHSGHGVELYLWVHGLGNLSLDAFFDPATDFGTQVKISRVE